MTLTFVDKGRGAIHRPSGAASFSLVALLGVFGSGLIADCSIGLGVGSTVVR